MALLEYLYTDHAPIEEGDSVEIMVLADRFCLPRLVTLCELYITKKVDSAIQKRVADGTNDVSNLLLTSQVRLLFGRTHRNSLAYNVGHLIQRSCYSSLECVIHVVFQVSVLLSSAQLFWTQLHF